jgi:hypothetical protein
MEKYVSSVLIKYQEVFIFIYTPKTEKVTLVFDLFFL